MEQRNTRGKRKPSKVENESKTGPTSNHMTKGNLNSQSEDPIATESLINGMSPLWREFYLKVGEKLKNS